MPDNAVDVIISRGNNVVYVVYGNQCGIKNKMKKVTEVSSASFNVKNIEGKKLKKGTSYKFILVAIDSNNKVVSSSKVIHVFTAGGKSGNHKKVIVKAKVGKKLKAVKKLTIKVRKKVKLKTQLVLAKKKLKVKKHAAVRFESDKPKIAVVSKAGVVKGLKKGKCTIFAYAQNGVYAKIKVTVK